MVRITLGGGKNENGSQTPDLLTEIKAVTKTFEMQGAHVRPKLLPLTGIIELWIMPSPATVAAEITGTLAPGTVAMDDLIRSLKAIERLGEYRAEVGVGEIKVSIIVSGWLFTVLFRLFCMAMSMVALELAAGLPYSFAMPCAGAISVLAIVLLIYSYAPVLLLKRAPVLRDVRQDERNRVDKLGDVTAEELTNAFDQLANRDQEYILQLVQQLNANRRKASSAEQTTEACS